ncbi:MAG: UDP-N-acetylglucosamine--N-acetylmuramyl-(pentapeptide) pyrophosphoryl-undecaprenol N-acetylglucosamine transferase [Epsilonproteobacteria bacterium]|nr:UDP-N-acetylglucosamine--N-acetylmuramyl-(pentapeptide) pyrophosphoryl-undecaprenol N-acetylglucosamine transferase [Campylobacterota bacterium]NPA56307.1 UDP-N-acetylglucosamine--N-acetylmuramyl-(pentapeptide) pyrophosphoryl-undecaprenol N-acetylglucosamine transferase [Campylobacterota bacterium]
MIALTGGGTGGHLAIVESLGEELSRRGIPMIFLGSERGQDREWFQNDRRFKATYFLASEGVVDKRGVGKVRSLMKIGALSLEAKRILEREGVKGVISVGGYSAAPGSFGALLAGIPLFIHEQNAHIGRLNRLLRPFCRRFFSSFFPPYDPYPVGEEFSRRQRIRERLSTILFLGGSQGAREINDLALKLAPELERKGIKIIHQTGYREFERVREGYRALGIEADLFPFTPEIVSKMVEADLAISRAGASTLWELAANALPALFLPYPYAAGDHQRKNAHFLVSKGAALFYTPTIRLEEIELKAMSQRLSSLFKPNGARHIIDEVLLLTL